MWVRALTRRRFTYWGTAIKKKNMLRKGDTSSRNLERSLGPTATEKLDVPSLDDDMAARALSLSP
jgi:hypothetical protein